MDTISEDVEASAAEAILREITCMKADGACAIAVKSCTNLTSKAAAYADAA